jgi:PTH2 family peptidyl-tRNA hydrolase
MVTILWDNDGVLVDTEGLPRLPSNPKQQGRSKVCCRVDSEEELMQIHDKALGAGLEVHLITDSGRTEFHGQPTRTCLAIGPDEAEKIDAITGHLPLL